MARGVILTLKPGEFDALRLTPNSFIGTPDLQGRFGPYFNHYNPAVALGGLKPGDFAYFQNNANYPRVHPMEPWSGEAVIVIGNCYAGWPKPGPEPYPWWLQKLADEYNAVSKLTGVRLPRKSRLLTSPATPARRGSLTWQNWPWQSSIIGRLRNS